MCLKLELGSKKARIVKDTIVTQTTIITKAIFVRRTGVRMFFFKLFLNLSKFFVKNIWANISHKINKIIISFLILENNLESISKPKKDACNVKNMQANNPK